MSRDKNLYRNTERVFGLLRGQCSFALQVKIKGLSKYEDRSSNFDVLWLIKEAKAATLGIDERPTQGLC